jgi:hypothetical protein
MKYETFIDALIISNKVKGCDHDSSRINSARNIHELAYELKNTKQDWQPEDVKYIKEILIKITADRRSEFQKRFDEL